jgi:voltage-gated potassium channel
MSESGDTRLGTWERAVEWPMALLALVFLTVYTVDVLAQDLDQSWHLVLRVVDYVIWAVFAGEFVVRIVLATDRTRYALRHFIDIIVLVVPFLRSLRVLRLIFLLRALNRWVIDSLRGKILIYGAGTAALFIFCGALAALDAERNHHGANIVSFGDALWWAAVTIFTVGYGDRFPVTTEGRVVGVCLMAGGVALVGAVTASFATWLIERVRVQEEIDEAADEAATRRDLRAVHAQLDRVEHEMAEVKALLRASQGVERPASASS